MSEYIIGRIIDPENGMVDESFIEIIRVALNEYLHGGLSKKRFYTEWLSLYTGVTDYIEKIHTELDERARH
jgi:hypothetical protein